MEEMVKGLMQNPAVLAILSKFAVDFIKAKLKDMDNQHVVDHYKKYVQLAVAVFSGISAFLLLALQGHAAEFDPKPLVEWALTMYLATQGVNVTVSNIKTAAANKNAYK